MSDIDIRKCDGPECNYQIERDKPTTYAEVSYHDFIILEVPLVGAGVYHFHQFNCVANFVAKKMGWTQRAN